MINWKRFASLEVFKTLRLKHGAVLQRENADKTTSDVTLDELALLDGLTAGTVTASKAVVVDANKDIASFRQMNVLGTGEVATNQALGSTALDANTTGARNVAIGIGALSGNTTGADNTAVGKDALLSATVATGNTALGSLAADAVTTGVNNTAVGFAALGAETTGVSNVAIGKGALILQNGATDNIAIGTDAGNALTTGSNNVSIGTNSLGAETTGINNIAIGKGALLVQAGATNNIAIGRDAGNALTTGIDNVAIGLDALGAATVATGCVAIGKDALLLCTTGISNIAIGTQAGDVITTGTKNIVIGVGSDPSAAGAVDQQTIGHGITNTANERVIIGGTTAFIACDWGTDATWDRTSDLRMKDVEGPSNLGLSFVKRLQPIEFRRKPVSQWPKEWGFGKTVDGQPSSEGNTTTMILGIAADDVKSALDAEGNPVFNGYKCDVTGRQSISDAYFVYPLINAVKELADEVQSLKERLH